ncbi:breast cancer type 1 susceptibility protein [Alligator mississippiensis]|uniref:RING-type E3 ubiquitin transferase n=1 Tax=Alligator mississippiensis TaxID=8496 RepID=A0A151PBW5_ALLMI|nr:breast cancer type 1 susceptibility protein [Alligator mississippiensis]
MDFSVVTLGDVQNVLSAMQKNLECPICLEVIKEPVSTKCDHIFCRLCMFKLLSKKKKSLVQCPLCKTEVTKRSLQENSRFKQLIEGLLKTIHAFELDSGVKFLNHQDFSKKPIETNSADTLHKESCVIQSKGYRNRQKKVKENGQENLTLQGTITGVQLSGNMVKWSSPRNKRRKLESDKIMYIEFGSDSSEDLFKKAGGSRVQDKEMFQTPPEKLEEELKYAENESPHNMQVTNLGGREILLSDFRGECDFSEEGLGSSEIIQNISEDFQAAQSNMSEDSANRPEDLRLVPSTKEKKNFSEGKEASPHENEELKGRKKSLQDEHQGDPNLELNIGEPSGYDSEASHLGDSYGLSSQSEILTTQQKNDMQNNLKKLQQEMAVLEAVLEQHGSQGSELPCSSVEGATATGLMITARGAMLTSEADLNNRKICSSVGLPRDEFHGMPNHCFNSNSKGLEEERSSASLLSTSKSHLLNKEARQHSFPKTLALEPNTPSQEGKSQQGDVALLLVQEAEEQCNQYRKEPENATEQKSETKLNSAAILSSPCGNMSRIPNSSPLKFLKRLSQSQTAEATNGSAIPCNIDDRKNTQGCELERRVFASAHVPHHRAGKENAKSPVVLSRKKMSIVASGLNQHEFLLVQKFAWKTQSTLSNQITEGTTHVIMKTDMDLVCERTLKYFLGIAGRKWVVSYQWVIQSFKERRILYESDFEVRGDVINGRNHQGPKRARQSQAGKLFKDFEICCYGPFMDMNTENLEWMVELCGASVVTQLHLFTHKAKHTAVVIVQPDAWVEDTGYRTIQQKCSATVVTREWVLDSVACYERQEFDAYLVSQE